MSRPLANPDRLAIGARPPRLPAFLADVPVRLGDLPAEGTPPRAGGVLWQAGDGWFRMEVPEVARFRVEAGRSVCVQPVPGCDPAALERFLWLTPLAALVLQQGRVPFHAAAVARGGRALLLAGQSGVGKSTLAAELDRRGWEVLADELAVVLPDSGGGLVVPPMDAPLLLWPDAIRALDLAWPAAPAPAGSRLPVPVRTPAPAAARPLHGVAWLGVDHGDGVRLGAPLAGMDLFLALARLTYNSHVTDALLGRAEYLRLLGPFQDRIPVRPLLRPRGPWTVPEWADRLEELLP